ncbi:MAG: ATP-dependent sacrificial sulfur transferase LarE [Lachnospiraceae bacterium]|nr:ATP-dependent sacrificial sulfur transferase LarE [Lachnospiraceae bacterium]
MKNMQPFFEQNPKVAIAFSGGVDSAFLLYLANKYAKEVKAYYVQSSFQPAFELADARKLCEEMGVLLQVLEVDVMCNPKVIRNHSDRCYFCKKVIFERIRQAAQEDNIQILLDGTNASDDAGDRPGMKALEELNVLSPLREYGYTKDDIRSGSKEAGLFVFDKPAYACLATRIPYETKITKEMLMQIEEAENVMFSLGFKDFRVRVLQNMAKLQLSESQLPLFVEKRKIIYEKLSKWFEEIVLDVKTR